MITGVYSIRNLANGKRYVGSASKYFSARFACHKRKLISGTHWNPILQRAWNKHGENNFSFEILEYCSPEDCIQREQYWIDFYSSSDLEFGYNLSPTAGSPRGVKHSDETKEKVSKALSGKPKTSSHAARIKLAKMNMSTSTILKMKKYARSRKKSHLKKLSEALKGKQLCLGRVTSQETKDKIAEKARVRWAEWSKTGRDKEIGRKIADRREANAKLKEVSNA